MKPRKCNLCCAFRHSSGKYPRNVENKVQREKDVNNVIPRKKDELANVACGEVVLKLFLTIGGR